MIKELFFNLFLKRRIKRIILENAVYVINDELTRQIVTDKVKELFLFKYLVESITCDESNNTAEIIDNFGFILTLIISESNQKKKYDSIVKRGGAIEVEKE